jgi:hypothetical protein
MDFFDSVWDFFVKSGEVGSSKYRAINEGNQHLLGKAVDAAENFAKYDLPKAFDSHAKAGNSNYKAINEGNQYILEEVAKGVENFAKYDLPKALDSHAKAGSSLGVGHYSQTNSNSTIEKCGDYMMNFFKNIFYISAYEHQNGQGSFFRNYNISSEDEQKFIQFSESYFNQTRSIFSNQNNDNKGFSNSVFAGSIGAAVTATAAIVGLATWYFTRSQYKEVSQGEPETRLSFDDKKIYKDNERKV